MPVRAARPVNQLDQQLRLDDQVVDLSTRALVVAVVSDPRWARQAEVVAGVRAAEAAGADVVEVPPTPALLGPAAQAVEVAVTARVSSPEEWRAALTAGASFVLASADVLDTVSHDGGQAAEVVALVSDARGARDAIADDPRRPVALDATGLAGVDAVSEESLALAVGARLVRTSDIRRTRRVVEVMARLLEARR